MNTIRPGQELIGARVKIWDGRIGTVTTAFGDHKYVVMVRGVEVVLYARDIRQCGMDTKFRTRKYCEAFGIVFVPMASLSNG